MINFLFKILLFSDIFSFFGFLDSSTEVELGQKICSVFEIKPETSPISLKNPQNLTTFDFNNQFLDYDTLGLVDNLIVLFFHNYVTNLKIG